MTEIQSNDYAGMSSADAEIVKQALKVLETNLKAVGVLLNSPRAVQDYLKLRLADYEYEVFIGLFLDAQHRLIAVEQLFRGTLTQTSVYPREVVRAVLRHNAAAVLLAHNHPSGVAEPSRADELLTSAIKQALDLIDVRVLDHLIIARNQAVSFAQRGLL